MSLLRRKRKKPKFDDPATHLKLVSFQKSLTQQLTAGGEAAVKSLEERFMAHDSDASGSLSEKEYTKAMKEFAKAAHLTDEATGKGFSTKDWQLIFAFMDDGEAGKGPDGKDLSPEIDFDEFLRFAGFDKNGKPLEGGAPSLEGAAGGTMESMPDDPDQFDDEWAVRALQQVRASDRFGGSSRFAGDGLQHMLMEKVWKNCFRWSGESLGVLGNTTRLMRAVFTARDRDRTGRLSPIYFEACLKAIPGTSELSSAHLSKLRESYRVYDEYDREKMFCDYERFIHDMAFGRLVRSEQLAHAAGDLRQCIRDKMGRATNLSRDHEATKLGKRLTEIIEGPTKSVATKGDDGVVPPLTGLVARRAIEQNCGIMMQEHTMFHIGADYVEKENRNWAMSDPINREILMDFIDDYALDLLDPTWNEGLVTDIVLREWSGKEERELDEEGYTVVPVDFSRFAMASKPGGHVGMKKPVFMFVQRKSRSDITLDPRAIVTDIALIANPTADEWKQFSAEGGQGWWPKDDFHGIFLFLKRGAVPTGGTNAPTAVSDIVIVIEDRDGMMSQTGAEASVRPSGMHHPAKRFDIPCCRLWLLQPHQRVAFDPIVAGTGGAAASGAIVPAGDAGRVVTSAALQHAVEMIRKNKDIANDLKHPSRWTRVVDTNRDGRVSHEELSRAFEFEYEIPMKALSYEEKKALFSAIDADTNGSVTMAEMTKFLSSYKMPSVRYEFQDAPHGHSSGASSSAGQRFLTLGAEVQAHYRSDGVWHDQFYPGIVSRISPDGTCDIKYDDGDSAKGVPPSRVRFRDGSAPSTGNPSSAGGMPHGGAQGAARRKAGVLRVRILSAAGLEGDDRYSWGIAASAAWQNPYGLLKIVHTRGGEHDAKFVKTSPAIRTAANGERGGTADWDAHKTYNRVTRLRVWEGGSDPMLHVQLRRSPVTEGRPAEEIGSGVVSLSDVLTATGSSAKRTVELNHGRGTVTLELSFVALAVPNSRDPSAPATKTPNEELKADDDCGGTLYASIIGLKGLSPTMLADGMHSSRPFIEFKLPWARTSGERATAKTLPLEPSQALIAGSGGAGAAAKFQHSRLELQVMEGRNLPSRADGGRPTAFIQMFVMDAEQHRAFLAGMPTESDAMYVDTMAGPKSSRTGPSDAKWFTEQIRSTSNPQWNEEFIFPSNKTDFVVLVVRDMLEPRNAMDHVSQAPIAYADVCISEFLNASSGSGDRTSQPRWLSLKPFVGGNPPPLSAKLQVELVVADTLQYESGSYQSQQLVRFESTDVLEGIRQAINRMAKSAGSKQASGGGLGLAVSLMHKTSWGEPSVLAVGTLEFTPTASAASAVPRSSSSGDKRTYSAWATLRLPSRASGGASASGEVACQALVELRFEPAHAQSSNVERIKVGIDLVDAKNIAYADASRSAAPPNPYVVGVRATGEEVFRSETKTATTNVSFNEFLGHFEVTSPQDTLEMKLMHAPRGHAGSWFSQSQSIPDALIGAAPISIGKKSWTAREGDVETLELMMEPSRDQQMLQGSLRSAGSIRVKLSVLEVHRAAGGLSAGSAASIIDPFANSPPSPYLATQSPQMRLQAVMHVKEMVLAAQSRGQSAQRMFAEKDPGNTGMVGLDVFRHVLATLLHAGAMQTGGMRGGSTFEGFHAEMQLVEEECRLATGKIDHRRFTAMLSSSNVQQLLRAPGTKRPPGPYSDSGTVGFSRGDTYSASLPIFDVERGAHSRALTLQPSYGSSSRANPQDLGGNGIDWLQAPRVLPRLWNDFERSDRDGLGHAPLETFLRVLRSVSSSLGDRGEIPEHLLQALARQFSPVSVDAASRHGRDCVNYEGLCTAIENGSALTSTRAPGATYASGVFNGMVRDAMEKSRKWAMRSFSGKDELKATLLVNGTRFGDTFAGGNSASSAFITRVIPRALFRRRLSSLGLVLDSSEWVSLLNAFNADGAGAVGVNVDSFISALKLDGAFVAEGGGWQSSKLVGAPGAAVSGVRALRWRVLESIFMRGAYGLDKAKDLLMHEDADGRNKGDMLQNDGIIGRSSFRRAIRRIVQGRVSRDAANELADDPRWRTGLNGMREAGVDFRRFLSLIADLDDRDIADLRRRVMAASAVGHLPSALNGGAGAIEHIDQYCESSGANWVSQRHFSKAIYTLHFPFSDAEIAAMCLRWRKPGSDEDYHHDHTADVDVADRRRGGRSTQKASKGVDVLYIPLLRAICGADNAGWDAGRSHSRTAVRARVPQVADSDDDDDDDELGENGAFELTRKLAAHDFYESMYATGSGGGGRHGGGHRGHTSRHASSSRHGGGKSRTHGGGHSSLISGTPTRRSATSRHRVDGHTSRGGGHSSTSRTFGGRSPPRATGRSPGRSPPFASRTSTHFGGRSPARASSRRHGGGGGATAVRTSRNFGDSRSRR